MAATTSLRVRLHRAAKLTAQAAHVRSILTHTKITTGLIVRHSRPCESESPMQKSLRQTIWRSGRSYLVNRDTSRHYYNELQRAKVRYLSNERYEVPPQEQMANAYKAYMKYKAKTEDDYCECKGALHELMMSEHCSALIHVPAPASLPVISAYKQSLLAEAKADYKAKIKAIIRGPEPVAPCGAPNWDDYYEPLTM